MLKQCLLQQHSQMCSYSLVPLQAGEVKCRGDCDRLGEKVMFVLQRYYKGTFIEYLILEITSLFLTASKLNKNVNILT